MRIKVKNPYLARHHLTMLVWGILTLLVLAACGAAVYFAGGPIKAWQALGNTTHALCETDAVCTLAFTALFKAAPLACIGFFIFSVWEKHAKFRSPRPGTCFTHITFGKAGVLLEKPTPAQNVFFPYGETSLHVTLDARLYHTKSGPRIHIGGIEFALIRQNGHRQTIQLLPPYRVLPFLCKILDKRSRFHEFSYGVSPLSDQQAAQTVLKKMDGYCQTGFMSVFDSKDYRRTVFWVGAVFAAGAVWTACSAGLELFFRSGFFLLIPLALWFLWLSLKDMYLERKSRTQ